MLLVHPVHEVLRQLPVLIGSIVLGLGDRQPAWPLAALGVIVGLGVLRWFITTYRIDDENVRCAPVCCVDGRYRCRATGFVRYRPMHGCCTGCWG